MGGKCCIVSEEKLSDEHTADLRLGSEARKIEQVAVAPRMDEDPIIRGAKGVAQEQAEEYPEEGWSKHTALLDSVGNGEGV